VAADSLEQARSHLRLERSRLDAGLSTPANALRVESQEAVAELLLVRLTNLAELLDDQLRTAMRDSSGKSYAIGEDLDAAIKTPIPPLEAAIVQSLEGRAELASTEYARQGEQSQAKAALTLLPPRLELYGALLDANPSPRYFPPQDRFHATWEMGARLTFSPNDAAISVAQARQHRARAAVLGAQRQRLIDGMRTEVVAARQAQEESRTALATTARGLAAAEESYRIRRSLFVEGRATSVELTDAETDLVRARFAAVDARIDLRLARIHLAKALGDRR
jgi:outer membrane protein TolC